MKVGILGGSFNPPHQGHLHISNLALKKLGLKQLWWIPTQKNPLKILQNNISKHDILRGNIFKINDRYLEPEEQINACKLITKNNPKIYIKNIDNFYSIDLINSLQSKYKNHQFVWIMGADNLMQLHQWRHFKSFMNKVELAVFSRGTFLLKLRNCRAFSIYKNYSKSTNKSFGALPKILICNNRKLNLSSTEIRNGKKL